MPLLHWLTRDEDIHAATHTPYCLLEQVAAYSHGDPDTGNMLIQGDNLAALKALLPYYAGKVKCAYIDPPFNTKSAFEHYDDNLEHSIWIGLLYPRLELLRQLLNDEGSLWISIDDNELGYLTVIADEIFGRKNRIFIATFKQSSASGPKAINPGVVTTCSYIICYAKNKSRWSYRKVFTARDRDSRYGKIIINPDDNFSEWRLETLSSAFWCHLGVASAAEAKRLLADKYEAELHKYVIANAQHVVRTARVAPRDINELAREALQSSKDTSNVVFVSRREGLDDQYFLNGEQLIFYKGKVRSIDGIESTSEPLTNLWSDLLSNNLHNEGGVAFPNGKKPEALIKRILEISTYEGDFVIDSFLGSGTTAAVAHKMQRRYIGVEMGDHAQTHCVPRLAAVISGEQSGISKTIGWHGGGGFHFYKLGVPVFDENGHVSPGIRFAPLAAHLWFVSTGIPYKGSATSPFLGEHEGVGLYLLYNGILGDKSLSGGNVLTGRILASLPKHDGAKVIFGEGCRLSVERLQAERITFRQIPYEIKAR
ncbi:MAG: site-specific DNA-methyltransferase [Nitrosospira sp.]